ncbi:MAG: nitroreductase family protein [Oscillospiraceae bacterium]|nr:nitroreductase family protein [Oscillospiraceae bacterium]
MELHDVLEARRSIRAYQPGKPVERETLNQLLAAAQQAPTWKNSQTGRYYVVVSPEKLAEIRETCLPARNAQNCADASALIITAFETKRSGFTRDGEPENELGDHWGVYDLGLQTENLLLKAAELGLGTLVMGIRDSEALRTHLNIPDSQEIVAVISVGYSAVRPEKPKRKAVEDIAVYF